jgi:hypothetical protein
MERDGRADLLDLIARKEISANAAAIISSSPGRAYRLHP